MNARTHSNHLLDLASNIYSSVKHGPSYWVSAFKRQFEVNICPFRGLRNGTLPKVLFYIWSHGFAICWKT